MVKLAPHEHRTVASTLLVGAAGSSQKEPASAISNLLGFPSEPEICLASTTVLVRHCGQRSSSEYSVRELISEISEASTHICCPRHLSLSNRPFRNPDSFRSFASIVSLDGGTGPKKSASTEEAISPGARRGSRSAKGAQTQEVHLARRRKLDFGRKGPGGSLYLPGCPQCKIGSEMQLH
jgi:hypothetical protein